MHEHSDCLFSGEVWMASPKFIALWNTRAPLQAQIDAAVKAERERWRKLAAARADYLEDAIHNGSGSKTLIASQKGGMIELRHIAAAIRKGEQP
jgi:hypothetical protein